VIQREINKKQKTPFRASFCFLFIFVFLFFLIMIIIIIIIMIMIWYTNIQARRAIKLYFIRIYKQITNYTNTRWFLFLYFYIFIFLYFYIFIYLSACSAIVVWATSRINITSLKIIKIAIHIVMRIRKWIGSQSGDS